MQKRALLFLEAVRKSRLRSSYCWHYGRGRQEVDARTLGALSQLVRISGRGMYDKSLGSPQYLVNIQKACR